VVAAVIDYIADYVPACEGPIDKPHILQNFIERVQCRYRFKIFFELMFGCFQGFDEIAPAAIQKRSFVMQVKQFR
jgi:hypothetical protein